MSHKSSGALIEVVPLIGRSPQQLLQIAQLWTGRPAANQISLPHDDVVKTHKHGAVRIAAAAAGLLRQLRRELSVQSYVNTSHLSLLEMQLISSVFKQAR